MKKHTEQPVSTKSRSFSGRLLPRLTHTAIILLTLLLAAKTALPMALTCMLTTGVIAMVVISYHNNSRMRSRSADLRKKEDLLSATLDSIGEGVVSCDTSGKVVVFNAMAQNITGCNPTEIEGKPIETLLRNIHSETLQESGTFVEQILHGTIPTSFANPTARMGNDGTERRISKRIYNPNKGIAPGKCRIPEFFDLRT